MAAKQKIESIPATASNAAAAAAGQLASKAPVSLIPAGPGLKLLVLTSGAVLMGLEIVGSRILAPYFGNSVFVWGSLISLFLIALSVGYYIGGGLSDRYPSRALLNSIILAVAALMFLIVVIGQPVCDAILRANFGEKSGPFLAGAILFLLPSIGMGMVSPFAIRLATATVASVGKTSGTLYALSTLGSILGTMLTTFVLIPNFGAGAILKGLAGALALVAVATFPFGSGGSAVRGSLAVLVAAAAGVFGLGDLRAAPLPVGSELVREINTPYHHISVIDNQVLGARELKFDRFTESAIELTEPHRSMSQYTTYFHLAFLPQPKIRRALFIGAGGGVGPRAFHQHDPTMEIDVVDIDQAVLDVASDDFYLPESENIRMIAADGRTFVRNSPDGHYDAIFLDAFTIGGRIPFHLVTREFFQLCRQKLAPGGVFVMNINSAVRGKNAEIFESMYTTLGEAFPQIHAFAIGKQQGLTDQSTNVMLVAVNSDQPMTADDWLSKAAAYESASYVGNAELRRMIGDLLTTIPAMKQATLFTDDYAPIETMSF
jgi:spermidine synthase